MKKIKRIIAVLLVLAVCAATLIALFSLGVIGGLTRQLPAIAYVQGAAVGEEIPCGKKTSDEFELIAQSATLKLYVRPEDANICVETATGERWYAFPPEGADKWARGVYKTEMVSALIIQYIDLELNETVKKNSQAASVKKNTFALHKLENGFRADYTFNDGKVTIPVEYLLQDEYLEVRILTGEIVEEEPERYILSTVRLLPYFGAGAEGEEGYIFVPDGQGALMHFNNGKGNLIEYRAAVYGDNASATRIFARADAYNATLPVFGIKRGDAAFLSIITEGENAAFLNAMPSYRDTSYANAWAEYKLRYTDSYILDPTSNLGQNITLYQDAEMEVSACAQRFYFLEGEKADYNGMADCYRNYLLTEGGLQEAVDDTVLFVDTYAAVSRRENILGVPVDRLRQLSDLADVQRLYEELRADLTGGIRLRVQSWARDALQGKLDTDLAWAAGNSWADWAALQSAVEAQGDQATLAVELAAFEKSGNGVVPIRDSAMSLSGSPAFQYAFRLSTRMRDEEERSYLLHPVLLTDTAEAVLARLDKQDVHSLSPLTIASTRYGSYGESKAYPEQTQQVVADVLIRLGESHDLVLDAPNAFALRYADYVADVPGGASHWDVLDETVPFLQLVYSGAVGYAGEAVNLSANPDETVLQAIATGGALHYELITGNAELLIETELNTLFSARLELWLPRMKEAAAQVAQAREATENSRLIRFDWIGEGVSVSRFENGAEICVNRSDEPVAWDGMEVPAGTWRARGEAAP